jgi:hypothetical protein
MGIARECGNRASLIVAGPRMHFVHGEVEIMQCEARKSIPFQHPSSLFLKK